MKKIAGALLIVCMLTMLAGCTPQSETPPDASQDEGFIELKTLNMTEYTPDKGISSFFGGDLAAAAVKMEPILTSALSLYSDPSLTVFTGGTEDDLDLKWQIVMALISRFGESSGLTADFDGNYIVTQAVIDDYFNNCFAGNTNGAPPISDAYLDMYNAETGDYTIPSDMDLPWVVATLKDITLSKANSAADTTSSATMIFSLRGPFEDSPKQPFAQVSVEVIANESSPFGYSVQSLDMIYFEDAVG